MKSKKDSISKRHYTGSSKTRIYNGESFLGYITFCSTYRTNCVVNAWCVVILNNVRFLKHHIHLSKTDIGGAFKVVGGRDTQRALDPKVSPSLQLHDGWSSKHNMKRLRWLQETHEDLFEKIIYQIRMTFLMLLPKPDQGIALDLDSDASAYKQGNLRSARAQSNNHTCDGD
ncbi:hypothetical protein RF11_14580 [Thelohanellus kitauei]|uniref:Uncharacterized protein n=1 Tax=Thelohanellus kitauei TaxID=669202 RepID=A0A0C2ITD5_THEKT|nr:hypothetical protein RF11_14580 [Thelohanellus kitauei]